VSLNLRTEIEKEEQEEQFTWNKQAKQIEGDVLKDKAINT